MCTLFQLPGLNGIAVGLFPFFVIWWIIWLILPEGPFDMDIDHMKGSFIPLLTMYVDIAKFVMGLASGSIAVLVGAAIYHSNGAVGPLLASFASPLFLLAMSLIWGVLFVTFIALDYEAY